MSGRYSQKANLLAGGFLVGGVVLAVLTSFVLADVTFARSREYVVRFSLRDGATGLAEDAAVRVGGQQQGKVESISLERDASTGEYVVDVRVSLRADIELYEDAWAYLEVPLLGTASTINIPYVGTGANVADAQGASPALDAGEVLRGSVAPPAFLANAGFGPEQRVQLQQIFASAERSMREISEALAEIRPRIGPVADDVRASVASARRSIESVETDLTGWRGSISATLGNVERASADLGPMTGDAKIILADAKELIRSGRAVVDDNRPRIDNILARTESVVTGVDEEWVPRGSALLDTTREGADRFAALGEQANQLLAEQRPGIERALANLRIASDQLKFLAIEARAQPWRLLHRPDTKELENQLLYDSARSYAVAVSDLRAASEAMDSIVAQAGEGGPIDAAALQSIRAKLQEAFERYAGAEAELMDRMIDANR
ncbi:MAG TPA: hypothetical protein VFF69_03670 [Phycisphaerales bacterium]|nr:hypothetical protein [Phycisphaerales bacterium]